MGTVPSWQLDKVERSLNQLTMVHLGVVHLLEEIPSMESPSGTIYSWQLEKMEGLLNQLPMVLHQLTMDQIGVVHLLELQMI